MDSFIPDIGEQEMLAVPFFEDVSAKDASGRWTEKPLSALKIETEDALAKLGAVNVMFTPGKFPGAPERFGFRITFNFRAVRGRIDCAALPLRTPTEKKKDRALATALYMLRDKLRSEREAKLYMPGSEPLIPYLIGVGDQTVAEALLGSGDLVRLSDATRTIEEGSRP